MKNRGGVQGVSPDAYMHVISMYPFMQMQTVIMHVYMHGYMLFASSCACTICIRANTDIVIMQIMCEHAMNTFVCIQQHGGVYNCCLHAKVTPFSESCRIREYLCIFPHTYTQKHTVTPYNINNIHMNIIEIIYIYSAPNPADR